MSAPRHSNPKHLFERVRLQSLSDAVEYVQSARKADGVKVEQSFPSEDMARRQRSWPQAISFQPAKHSAVFGSAPDKDDGEGVQMFTLRFILATKLE